MVGTIPLRSILWMAAAETSALAASCWRDSRWCCRSCWSLGPIELTMPSTRAPVTAGRPERPGAGVSALRPEGLAAALPLVIPAPLTVSDLEYSVQHSKRTCADGGRPDVPHGTPRA